jgi:hypothetical protein
MTTSPNLGITHVEGSQNNKHITVNEAIDKLDDAMNDQLSVDVSAGATTLSTANFRAYFAFYLTGAPSGALDFTVPDSVKRFFFVRNDCGQTVTVKRSSGATVAIADSDSRLLTNDGTDIVEAGAAGGGGGAVAVDDEGSEVLATASRLNFTGSGVTATDAGGGEATITIPGVTTVQNWAVPHRGAMVKRTSDQSISTATDTTVSWQSEVRDTDSIWSIGDPTKLVVPTGATKVKIRGQVRYSAEASAANAIIGTRIQKNGSDTYDGRGNEIMAKSAVANVITQACETPVLDVTPGDYFTLVCIQGTGETLAITANAATWFEMEIVEVDDADPRPYDLGFFYPGEPGAGELIFKYKFSRDATLPASATGSDGDAGVAATASAAFDLRKSGVSVGTITWAIGAAEPTFTVASAVDFTGGTDTLEIVAPGSPDATLADISITFKLELT